MFGLMLYLERMPYVQIAMFLRTQYQGARPIEISLQHRLTWGRCYP